MALQRRGVALVEALAALAVMAVGLLGVVGMQATLRSNSDTAKQRSEAVRIAQAEVENLRAFETLAAGGATFVGIVDGASQTIIEPLRNATYTRTAVVRPVALGASAPQLKTVTMAVTWQDRSDRAMSVNLVSSIAGIAPELGGSLGLAGDRAPTQRPRGRHPAVPAGAVPGADAGTSEFAPPGGGGVTWVFNNTSGVITSVCSRPNPCVPGDLLLLSGFIRFAIGDEPDPTEGEQPVDSSLPGVGVIVRPTLPVGPDVTCFTQTPTSTAIAYYCAVPILPTTTTPNVWSGQSLITGLPISASMADPIATNFKVCRYTPQATHTPTGGNVNHPLDYANVNGPLTQQNFLVISAGNGTTAYVCPGDGPLPFVNSNTFPHQPSS